jgi:hypothetical protein
MREPSGEKHAERTSLSCPSRVLTQSPLFAFQSFAVPSLELVRMRRPFGEKAVEYTAPSWPSSSWMQEPVTELHT